MVSDAKTGQQQRWGDVRLRAIKAARELAAENGYDGVQIRDVVARTGLSSATIYRHFTSRDHLIAEAHLEWIRSTFPTARRRLPSGGTAADRVARLLHQTCVAVARSPNLGKALMYALGSPDDGVRECRAAANAIVTDTIRDAIGEDLPDPDDVLLPLGLAWQGALFSWAHDQMSMDVVDELLQRTVHLLFDGVLAGARGQRP